MQGRRSHKLRENNTHRVLWYLQRRTSEKNSEWRDVTIRLLFELYELRRNNPGVLLWVRAVDGISVYLDQRGVVDLQLAQKHIVVNAASDSPLLSKGDRLFGKKKRHDGSGNRQWKLNAKEDVLELIDFLNKLPTRRSAAMSPSRVIPQRVRELVMERDNGRCQICKSKANLHFDHILPFSKGGGSSEQNIRVLCATHNLEQGSSMRY